MGRIVVENLYEMLASDRRRVVLGVLAEADEPLDRTEIARRLVTRQRRTARAAGSPTAGVDSVTISLGHVHLPKLEEGGLIERTGDDRYGLTGLGADVERAARAFERSLDDRAAAFDRDSGPVGGGVTANDCDGDDR